MSEENVDHCSFVSIHYIICECGETFPSEDALKSHLEKEHPHKREKKEYKCGICSQVYGTEEECVDHYEANHIAVSINLEHFKTEDSDEFQDEQILEEVVESEICPEDAALQEAIMTIKQETFDEGDTPLLGNLVLPVKFEDPSTTAAENGIEHKIKKKRKGRKIVPKSGTPEPELVFVIQEGQKRGELVSMLKKSGRLPKGQRIVTCEVCGKSYASNAALRYHQRTHTGERPYQCNFCNKTFTMPLFLQIHVRTHTGERPYECAACPKAFSNKAALMRHERVHTGEKPYACPMCAKTFTQSNSMKLHVTTVHLKQPTPYKSKNRKLKAEERLQTNPKSINPRTKIAAHVDSVEVLKNGLESYVLGPLKADLDNLKSDIDMLARGEFDEELNAVQSIEVKESYEVIEEVMYEDDENCEVVSSEITSH